MLAPQAIDAYGARIAPRPSLNPANPAPHTLFVAALPVRERLPPWRGGRTGSRVDTSREKLDTFGEKLDTFGEEVNTCRPSVDTWAGSGEQVFTPAPVCALSETPLRAPPDRPPSPRAALPFVLNKCTIGAYHPHVLPVMPRVTCPPSQPPPAPPASHISRYAACRFPVHSGSSDKLPRSLRRRAPRARQRLAARAAGGRPEPESPARPKIRSKLSLASPIPIGDRAGERQFPPSPPPIRRPRPGSSGDRPAGSNRQGQPPKRRGV